MNSKELLELKKCFANYKFFDISNQIKKQDDYNKYMLIAKKTPEHIYVITRNKINHLFFVNSIEDGHIHIDVNIILLSKEKWMTYKKNDKKLNLKRFVEKFIKLTNKDLKCKICMEIAITLSACENCCEIICHDCCLRIYIESPLCLVTCPFCRHRESISNKFSFK